MLVSLIQSANPRRMVAPLQRDDDQSIADELSYRPIIVPWQGMGVKAVGTAAERG